MHVRSPEQSLFVHECHAHAEAQIRVRYVYPVSFVSKESSQKPIADLGVGLEKDTSTL